MFNSHPTIEALSHALSENKSVVMEELWSSPKAYFAALAQKVTGKNLLVISSDSHLFHDLSYFSEREVTEFPQWETLPTDKIPPSPDIVGMRYQILQKLLKSEESTIVFSKTIS